MLSKDERLYVITYKELIFTFLIFCVILIVLYPKEMLKNQILAEDSNYDLSILYLQNLLEHDPDNEGLMLLLADKSLRNGKKDLSVRLLNLLHNSKNSEYRKKSLLLSYKLSKEDYFYLKDKKRKLEQKELLKELFLKIYNQKMYSLKEKEKWLKESLFLNLDSVSYNFLKEQRKNNLRNIDILKQLYYFSEKLDKREESRYYLIELIKYDSVAKEKWKDTYYYALVNGENPQIVEKYLLQEAKNSLKWKERLVRFYIDHKEYGRASNVYMQMFELSLNYRVKRDYFYKAVNILQAANKLNKAANLAHRYENYYLHDEEVRKYLLRLYIATNNLDYAAKLSDKIIRRAIY